MALARTQDRILMVDHEPALNYSTDMNDNLHPNNAGYAKMADVWYQPLVKMLPVCSPTAPQIATAVQTVSLGENLSLTLDHVGYPQPTFSIVSGPAGMTVNPDTGIVTWTPSNTGTFSVEVAATNSQGQGTASFTVNVD